MENRDDQVIVQAPNQIRVQVPNIENPVLTLTRDDESLQQILEVWKTSPYYPALGEAAENGLYLLGDPSKKGIAQLISDYVSRDWLINRLAHIGLSSQEKAAMSSEELVTRLKQTLAIELQVDENDPIFSHVIAAHSQNPSYLPNWIMASVWKGVVNEEGVPNDETVLEPSELKIKQCPNAIINLVKRGSDVFLEIYMDEFPIVEDDKSIGIFKAPMKYTFKMVEKAGKWGYQCIDIATSSEDLKKMLECKIVPEAVLRARYCQPKDAFKATIYDVLNVIDKKLPTIAADDRKSAMLVPSPHYELINTNLRNILNGIRQLDNPNYPAYTNLMRLLIKVANNPTTSLDQISALADLQGTLSPAMNEQLNKFLAQLASVAELEVSRSTGKNTSEHFKFLNIIGTNILDPQFQGPLNLLGITDRVNLLNIVSTILSNPLNGSNVRALGRLVSDIRTRYPDNALLNREMLNAVKKVYDASRMILGGDSPAHTLTEKNLKGSALDASPNVKRDVIELIKKANNLVSATDNPKLIAEITDTLNLLSNLLEPRDLSDNLSSLRDVINNLRREHADAIGDILPLLDKIANEGPAIQLANAKRSLISKNLAELNVKVNNWSGLVDDQIETLNKNALELDDKKTKKMLTNEAKRQENINQEIMHLVGDLEKEILKAADKKSKLALDDIQALQLLYSSMALYFTSPTEYSDKIAKVYDSLKDRENVPPKIKQIVEHLGNLTQFAEARKHLLTTINDEGHKDSTIAKHARELLSDIDARSTKISKPMERMRLMSAALNETAEIIKDNNRDLTKYRRISEEISKIPTWKKVVGGIVAITGLVLIGVSVGVACASLGVFSVPSVAGIALGGSMVALGASIGVGAAISIATPMTLWRMFRKPLKNDMQEVMKDATAPKPPANNH